MNDPVPTLGRRGRSLDHCLQDHLHALKSGDVAAIALAEHVLSSDHQVDLSKATLFDAHTQTRCMLESWHIQHQQAPLNRDRGTLPGLYAALLDFFSTLCFPAIFLTSCYCVPHVTTSLTDCPIVFIHLCL